MAEEQNKNQIMSVDEALRRLIEFDKKYVYPNKLDSGYVGQMGQGDEYKISLNTLTVEKTDKNLAELLLYIKSAEKNRHVNPVAKKFYSILAKYAVLRDGYGKELVKWDGKGQNPNIAEFIEYIKNLSDKKLQADVLQMTIANVAEVSERGELTDMFRLYTSNENVNFDSMCKLYQNSHDKKLKSMLYGEILHKARHDRDFNLDKREALAAIAKEENDLDARDKEFDFSGTKFMAELRLRQETETKAQAEQQLAKAQEELENKSRIIAQLEQQLAEARNELKKRDARIDNLNAVVSSLDEQLVSSIKKGKELKRELNQQTDKTQKLIDATQKMQIGIGSRGVKKTQELAAKIRDGIEK